MPDFFIVRLGKESVPQIKLIDSLHSIELRKPGISIECSQVPKDFTPGKYCFICLGSDNNKGIPTDWVRGLRAFGVLVDRSGGSNYNDTQELKITVTAILEKSATQKRFLAESPAAYFWFSDMPVIGLDTHSNQTVQQIDAGSSNQDVRALFYALELMEPGFRSQITNAHPDLAIFFNYTPPSPDAVVESASSDATTPSILPPSPSPGLPQVLPADWILALAARGFLIVSGPSGTGKSRTARDIARCFDYALESRFAATLTATRPSTSLSLVPVGADWTDGTPLLGYRNMFGPPRTVLNRAGAVSTTNEVWTAPSTLLLILRALGKPDQPHFLVLDEMNLSHVERYFSDFLSLLEVNRGLPANAKIPLLDSDAVKLIAATLKAEEAHPFESEVANGLASRGSSITIPDNLFVVGTVNVDETTYMFSPKVLDRAHVLELTAPIPSHYLAGTGYDGSTLKVDVALKVLVESALRRRNGFWEQDQPASVLGQILRGKFSAEDIATITTTINRTLDGLYKLLDPVGFGFGMRTTNEVVGYLACYFELNDAAVFAGEQPGWVGALDRAIYQKILPKIHGGRRHLGASLKAVGDFLLGGSAAYSVGKEAFKIEEADRINQRLTHAASKVRAMNTRLEVLGHTTFIT